MTSFAESEILSLSISALGQLYRNKQLSPLEVVRASLERLERVEPYLNAFITVLADAALQQAGLAEQSFLDGDAEHKSPLYGVPVSLKDNFSTRGVRTTAGSRILKDFVPDSDAEVVRLLKQHGAIVLGKTNMLEFANGTVHPDYGQCNNPWDVRRTAGGSSSGSASSIAAGVGFASLGTDTGGSVRIPASFCGIVGMKPTYQAISCEGVFPLSWTFDHVGPLTRTTLDNAVVFEALSGRPMNLPDLTRGDVQGLRVGVIRSLTDTVDDVEVRARTTQTLERCAELGACLVDVEIPGLDAIEQAALPVLLAESAYVHRGWLDTRKADYARVTHLNLLEGVGLSAFDYLQALDRRHEFTQAVDAVLASVDVLVCPTVPYGATLEDLSFEDGGADLSARTFPFNVSGHPALSIPCGPCTATGLPVGFQLVGRRHEEHRLYQAAHALETSFGGFPAPIWEG